VYVESAFPSGGRLGGTGVMVGPNDVLTASHLLYSAQQGGAATSVKVVAAYNSNLGFTPYGEAHSTSFHYHNDYDPDGDRMIAAGDGGSGLAGSELDLGIIDLSTALGQQTGWMTMDPGFSSGTLNVSGYSASAGWKLLSGVSNVTDDGTDSITYTPNLSLTPGNSGGPLWYQGADGGHVVGVISTPGWAADVRGTISQLQGWVSGNDHMIAGASQTPSQPAPAPAPDTGTSPGAGLELVVVASVTPMFATQFAWNG
jgi:V8-like Glu-specific endopeptidase